MCKLSYLCIDYRGSLNRSKDNENIDGFVETFIASRFVILKLNIDTRDNNL